MLEEILKHIPQRPPFLFIDEIIDRTENSVTTKKILNPEEDFFKGHFPGNPVMPGVLLSEAVFQTGALLMSLRGENNQGKTSVVTRIQNAKFKNLAKPNDELVIKVDFVESLGNASFMKGKITTTDKTIMTIEFACAQVEESNV